MKYDEVGLVSKYQLHYSENAKMSGINCIFENESQIWVGRRQCERNKKNNNKKKQSATDHNKGVS